MRIKTSLFAALAALLVFVGFAAPASAGSRAWVAVAAASASGQPYTAWGYTENDAYRNATARCENDTGRPCQVYSHWTNGCRIIAQRRGGWRVLRYTPDLSDYCIDGRCTEVVHRCSE